MSQECDLYMLPWTTALSGFVLVEMHVPTSSSWFYDALHIQNLMFLSDMTDLVFSVFIHLTDGYPTKAAYTKERGCWLPVVV